MESDNVFKKVKSGFDFTVNRIFDYLVLSVLHVLLCIPVITIGAARTALYKTAVHWTEGDEAAVLFYLKEFRKEFRGNILTGLLTFLFDAFVIMNAFLIKTAGFPDILKGASIVAVLCGASVIQHVYLTNALFKAGRKDLVRDGVIMILSYPFRSLASALLGILIPLPAVKAHLVAIINSKVYRELREQVEKGERDKPGDDQ